MEKGIKEPVRIRRKKIANGNESLYLDIYLKGKRHYEFLRLYLVPERTRADKEKNKETLRLADAIRSKRVVELRNGMYGFNNSFATGTNFLEYFRAIAEKRGRENLQRNHALLGCYKHIRTYDSRENLTFADITQRWVQGFRDYLDRDAKAWEIEGKPLSQNSKRNYFKRLRTCINRAVAERIIPSNPMQGIEDFKEEEVTRMYLTIEEIKTLARTDCEYPGIKRAFLFSCLTGLRRSDILKLTWGEVHEQGKFTRLIFRQKKTKGQEYLDITGEARVLMGERGKPDEHPFTGLMTLPSMNRIIREWVLRAGIDKKITFHCARHTFAVMMLDLETDIYTVSKLLGHREISTTQIYAKVLDKNKQAAVAAIPSILATDGNKQGIL